MPELPEVETIKRGLVSKIKGKTIYGAKILLKRVTNVSPNKFIKSVKNRKIINIERRAKILIITLSNNVSILIHLKMTGQLIYQSKIEIEEDLTLTPKNPYPKNYFLRSEFRNARVIFFFSDGSALIFKDARKFGYVKIMNSDELRKIFSPEKFGPEPLSTGFTIERFKGILNKYLRRRIKQVLMDQSAISGIGNIYSDEICFYAKISPCRRIDALTDEEIKNLWRGIKYILPKAIKMGGSSINTYVNVAGQKGSFVKEMRVYGRENKKCLRCEGMVKRIKIGGRSSFFCPLCQI